LWKVLDSPLFDKALSAAKAAAVTYATKQATDFISGMGRKKKQSPALAGMVARALAGPGANSKSRPLHGQHARSNTPRKGRGPPIRRIGRKKSKRQDFGPRTSLPVTTGRSFKQNGGSINGRQSTIVRKREYLQDVLGSVAFTNTTYAVNPGLPISFPWLAPIASSYEEYRFLKLNFLYETSSSSATQGEVMMVIDYDAYDAPFQNKQLAMNYKAAVRTQSWAPISYNLDRSQSRAFNQLFVRSGAVPGDLKTYDVGLFQLITQGQTSATVIGELYVEYEVELIGPKTDNVIGASLIGADIRGGGTLTPANFLGTAPVIQAGSQLSVVYAANVLTIPTQPGQYLICISATGTTFTALSVAFGAGATQVVLYSNVLVTGGASIIVSANFPLTGGTITVTCTAATVATSSVVIQQMSAGLSVRPPKRPGLLVPLTKEEALQLRLDELERKLSRFSIVTEPQYAPPQLMVAQMTGN
jgi:hypothetical protein